MPISKSTPFKLRTAPTCANKLLILSENITKKNTKLQINLALNYESKIELINAFVKLNKSKKKINEKNFITFLETNNIPDKDLMIKTGNTKILRHFLLYTLSYS